MEYRNLGKTGMKVSALCLGSMQFGWTADETTSYNVLNEAHEAGVNFIDTADIYSRWVEGNPGGVSETIIGQWIKKFNIKRDRLIIATKVRGRMGDGPNDEGLSRLHIQQAVENSLRRLQIDAIDLYQTHWFDNQTPIEETLRTLDDLVHQGKVRYIGCSNLPAWRLMEALWTSDCQHLTRFNCLQPHYNLIHRAEFESELAEVCSTYSLGVIPYSPLAGGFLSGKYQRDGSEVNSPRAHGVRKYFIEQNWLILEQMTQIATAHDASISQVALAWQLQTPPITSPIIGPRNVEQLQDNLGAVELRLTVDEMEELNQLSKWKT